MGTTSAAADLVGDAVAVGADLASLGEGDLASVDVAQDVAMAVAPARRHAGQQDRREAADRRHVVLALLDDEPVILGGQRGVDQPGAFGREIQLLAQPGVTGLGRAGPRTCGTSSTLTEGRQPLTAGATEREATPDHRSRQPLPATTLDLCEAFIATHQADIGDISTHAAADAAYITRITLRIHAQHTDIDIRRRCLDLIDQLVVLQAHNIESELDTIER